LISLQKSRRLNASLSSLLYDPIRSADPVGRPGLVLLDIFVNDFLQLNVRHLQLEFSIVDPGRLLCRESLLLREVRSLNAIACQALMIKQTRRALVVLDKPLPLKTLEHKQVVLLALWLYLEHIWKWRGA
jgi:hypothetical protein